MIAKCIAHRLLFKVSSGRHFGADIPYLTPGTTMTRFTVLIVVVYLAAVSGQEIWPHPKDIEQKKEFFSVDPKNFTVKIKAPGACEIMEKAIARYLKERMFIQDCRLLNVEAKDRYFLDDTVDFGKQNQTYRGELNQVVFRIRNECETTPHVGMDEAYNVSITDKTNAYIESHSVWGALRGLETFSQLIKLIGKNQFKIQLAEGYDRPRFDFRGFMIDTSRHYLPMKAIYETLDAMEMNKFNVLHWHLVDDQSFPFVSTTFPELSQKGAFLPHYVYSVDDVRDVIEYGRLRGIRVLPEFDTPGHTLSWGKGQPDLLTKCYDKNSQPTERHGPINPILNGTYEFLDKLFHEIAERFVDKYIHLGGDEVDFTCWQSNPEVQAFMKKQQFGTDYRKLESYYMQKLIEIVDRLNRSYIVWQEVFDNHNDIRPETVVHVWKGSGNDLLWQQELKNVTNAGFHAILSSCWYLNYIRYGSDWENYYMCEPQNFNGTTAEKNLVIGGEACMWGEWVDGSNLISRTWPRAAAVAERLWSPENIKDLKRAKPRFHMQRCRMQMLGIRVSPNEGAGYFCHCDDLL